MKSEPIYDNKTSTYSYNFTVDDLTTVKQFQFYRNPEKLLDGKNWLEIENLVTISFSEQTQEQQKSSTDFTGTE